MRVLRPYFALLLLCLSTPWLQAQEKKAATTLPILLIGEISNHQVNNPKSMFDALARSKPKPQADLSRILCLSISQSGPTPLGSARNFTVRSLARLNHDALLIVPRMPTRAAATASITPSRNARSKRARSPAERFAATLPLAALHALLPRLGHGRCETKLAIQIFLLRHTFDPATSRALVAQIAKFKGFRRRSVQGASGDPVRTPRPRRADPIHIVNIGAHPRVLRRRLLPSWHARSHTARPAEDRGTAEGCDRARRDGRPAPSFVRAPRARTGADLHSGRCDDSARNPRTSVPDTQSRVGRGPRTNNA